MVYLWEGKRLNRQQLKRIILRLVIYQINLMECFLSSSLSFPRCWIKTTNPKSWNQSMSPNSNNKLRPNHSRPLNFHYLKKWSKNPPPMKTKRSMSQRREVRKMRERISLTVSTDSLPRVRRSTCNYTMKWFRSWRLPKAWPRNGSLGIR